MLWYAFGKNSNLDFSVSDINQLDPNAFNSNLISLFYSCNTATGGDNTFAKLWYLHVGGITRAAVGKPYYGDINNDLLSKSRLNFGRVNKRFGGLRTEGSTNEPTLYKKAYWVYY